MNTAPQQKVFSEKVRGFHITSASTGALEFLPVPFLDEWMIRRQRKSMVESILSKRGIEFQNEATAILVGSGQTLLARIGSITRGIIMKPLKKIFRSVLFWLTARSAARTAMVTYFLARFLHHPSLIPPDAGNVLTSDRAHYLANSFREISRGIDVQAVRGTFRQLVGLFARSEKASGKEISETIEKSAPGFIAEFDSIVQEKLAS